MTAVEFHLLPMQQPQQRLAYACRLAAQAFRAGRSVYIHHDNEAGCAQFGELLWSYRDNSFLPSGRSGDHPASRAIQLGFGPQAPEADGVIINLAASVPDFIGRFEQAYEIVIEDEQVKTTTRENYRYYKDHGYPLRHERITSSG